MYQGKFEQKHPSNVVKKQKEVIKASARFEKTEQKLLGGNSRILVARKKTKSGFKEYALKEFASEYSCATDKIAYDLFVVLKFLRLIY